MEFCSLGFAIIATYFCALKYVATYDAEKDAFGHFQVFGCFYQIRDFLAAFNPHGTCGEVVVKIFSQGFIV